jgi:hypothetical protein
MYTAFKIFLHTSYKQDGQHDLDERKLSQLHDSMNRIKEAFISASQTLPAGALGTFEVQSWSDAQSARIFVHPFREVLVARLGDTETELELPEATWRMEELQNGALSVAL